MAQLSELELDAWRAFLETHARVLRRLDAELIHERGLTLSAYEVLLTLRYAPDRALRMSRLAERVLLSPSGATRAVDQLVRRGLVERRRDPSDARVFMAVLTQAGARALREAAPVHLRGIRRHFTGLLTERQLAAVAKALTAVCRGAAETPG